MADWESELQQFLESEAEFFFCLASTNRVCAFPTVMWITLSIGGSSLIVEKNFANKVKARPVNTGVEITKGHLAVIAQRMAWLLSSSMRKGLSGTRTPNRPLQAVRSGEGVWMLMDASEVCGLMQLFPSELEKDWSRPTCTRAKFDEFKLYAIHQVALRKPPGLL